MSDQVWYISNATYSRIIDVLARYGYGSEEEAAEQVRREFGLRPFINYRLVVESEEERVQRSLADFGLAWKSNPATEEQK